MTEEDERTEEDGKWKIGQCSVGPETAIMICNQKVYPKELMKTHIPKKKGQDNNYYVICANLNGMSLLDSSPIIGLNCLLHTRAC